MPHAATAFATPLRFALAAIISHAARHYAAARRHIFATYADCRHSLRCSAAGYAGMSQPLRRCPWLMPPGFAITCRHFRHYAAAACLSPDADDAATLTLPMPAAITRTRHGAHAHAIITIQRSAADLMLMRCLNAISYAMRAMPYYYADRH